MFFSALLFSFLSAETADRRHVSQVFNRGCDALKTQTSSLYLTASKIPHINEYYKGLRTKLKIIYAVVNVLV